MILLTNFAWRRLQWKPLPVPSIADVPLLFLTVQLYLPETSVTDWAMVSTVSYAPVEELVTTCVCWYVALIVNTVPFFLQVTVVAGPPVEVQVKDRFVSSYIKVVAVGVPTMGEHYILWYAMHLCYTLGLSSQRRNNKTLPLAMPNHLIMITGTCK